MFEDLYTQWLDIPREACPPNHYVMLGLSRECADANEIEQAACRRLETLDRYALHSDLIKRAVCQEMMNQVARARTVLIDPERRAAYNSTLPSIYVPIPRPEPYQLPYVGSEPEHESSVEVEDTATQYNPAEAMASWESEPAAAAAWESPGEAQSEWDWNAAPGAGSHTSPLARARRAALRRRQLLNSVLVPLVVLAIVGLVVSLWIGFRADQTVVAPDAGIERVSGSRSGTGGRPVVADVRPARSNATATDLPRQRGMGGSIFGDDDGPVANGSPPTPKDIETPGGGTSETDRGTPLPHAETGPDVGTPGALAPPDGGREELPHNVGDPKIDDPNYLKAVAAVEAARKTANEAIRTGTLQEKSDALSALAQAVKNRESTYQQLIESDKKSQEVKPNPAKDIAHVPPKTECCSGRNNESDCPANANRRHDAPAGQAIGKSTL
jgi:hypothetical protein